jgi:carbon monoxide dehydrogenase subunit G
MLLEVKRVTDVGVSQLAAWALLRDVTRLSACIPKVSDLAAADNERDYTAVVSDRIGPFSLTVPVKIELQSIEEPRRIAADVVGDDKRGQARVRGTLEAIAEPKDGITQLTLSLRMEVLGRLAALGAVPIRRRADDIFDEFVQRLRAELGAA